MTTSSPATLGYPDATVSPEVDTLLLGSSDLPAQLRRAVDESTRLLNASGAILYLLDESGSNLRWAYDSGIRDADELAWVRSLSFSVGVGLFGRSLSEGHPMSTSDYRSDTRFVHSALLDRFVDDMDVRSMAVAPLIGTAVPLGALGVFSHESNAYSPRPSPSRSGRPAPTSATSSASSGSPAERRRRCTRWSTAWSVDPDRADQPTIPGARAILAPARRATFAPRAVRSPTAT